MTNLAANENSRLKIVLASLIGTSIEYFDFYAYLTASVLVFPSLFFAGQSPALAQLSSLATFGLAFFARPLGAVLFGHFGDRYGRKNPLIASLLTMGGATFLIGLLPTDATWGGFAAVALAVLRLAQGLGLGGEWSGAALIAVENAPAARRGLYGTLPQFGAPVGFFLANLLFLISYAALPHAAFLQWGWRVPFLLSAVLVVIGLVLRVRLAESIVYQRVAKQAVARFPLATALRTAPSQMARGVLALLAPYAIFYLISTFVLAYATSPRSPAAGQKTGLGFSYTDFLMMLLIAVLFQGVLVALTGFFTDRVGRKPVLLISYGCILLFGVVFGSWLAKADAPASAQLFLIIGFVLSGAVSGPIGAFLPELFPTNVRYTASAVAYSVAGILGAAFLPLIAYSFWTKTGDIAGVGALLVGLSVVSFVAVLGAPERRGVDLNAVTADRRFRRSGWGGEAE